MTTLEEAIAKLREVQKFTTPGREFTEQELQINIDDSILIKELKKGKKGKPIMVDTGTQTEITYAEIKQMEQDGGDLRQAISQFVPLTNYKKESEARLNELDSALKTYEQTQLYLKTEAQRDKGLISELTKQAKNKELTEEQLIVKIRELEKKLTKPLMVSVGTQTELTMAEIAEMETTIQSLSKSLGDQNLVNPNEQSGRDILFRLDIIRTGIFNLENDKKHIDENGQKLKKELEKLVAEIEDGTVREKDLTDKVNHLEALVKTKDELFEQRQKENQEDYDTINNTLDEVRKKLSEVEQDIDLKSQELEASLRANENTLRDKSEIVKVAKEEKARYETSVKKIEEEKKDLIKKLNDLLVEVSSKEELNKELVEEINKTKNKDFGKVENELYGRSWKGFYNWMLANVIEKPIGSGWQIPMKPETKNVYPNLFSKNNENSSLNKSEGYLCSLVSSIRVTIGVERMLTVHTLPPWRDGTFIEIFSGRKNIDTIPFGAVDFEYPISNFQFLEIEKMFNNYIQATASVAILGTKPSTTSNLVWNDYYWWVKKNIVEESDTLPKTRKWREGEGKDYPKPEEINEPYNSLNFFLNAFEDQSANFLPYEGNKRYVDLLVRDGEALNSLNVVDGDKYKKYYNNLLDRYRKTVTIVEYKRDWLDFSSWIEKNMMKLPPTNYGMWELKDELKDEYPTFTTVMMDNEQNNRFFFTFFYNTLRNKMGLWEWGGTNGSFLDYDDTKNIKELWRADDVHNIKKEDASKDAGKMLEKYRQETKTLKQQILTNVPVGVVKKRTWIGLSDWIVKNIVDVNEIGWIKKELKNDYPNFVKFPTRMNSLLTFFKTGTFPGKVWWNLPEYDDNKTFIKMFETVKGEGYSYVVYPDEEKLLTDWRKDTPLQTQTGKVLTQEEIDILGKLNSFTKTSHPSTSEGYKEIVSNFEKGVPNINKELPNLGLSINLMRNLYSSLASSYDRLEKNNEESVKKITELTKQLNKANQLQQDRNKLLNYLKLYREQPFIPISLDDEGLLLVKDKEFMKGYFKSHGWAGGQKSLFLSTSLRGSADELAIGINPIEIDLSGAGEVSTAIFSVNFFNKLIAPGVVIDYKNVSNFNAFSYSVARGFSYHWSSCNYSEESDELLKKNETSIIIKSK